MITLWTRIILKLSLNSLWGISLFFVSLQLKFSLWIWFNFEPNLAISQSSVTLKTGRFTDLFSIQRSLWCPSAPGNDSWARILLWLINKMAPSSVVVVGRKIGFFAVKTVKWLKQISYSGSRLRTADCWTLSGNTTYVKMSLAIVKFVLVVNKVGKVMKALIYHDYVSQSEGSVGENLQIICRLLEFSYSLVLQKNASPFCRF